MGKNTKPQGELTVLAVVLIAVTLLWTLGAGSFAVVDVLERRGTCQEWLVKAGSGEQGWRRVYDRQSVRQGCSITKLGLKGYMAERPIYPNFQWLFIVFGIPAVLSLTYAFLLKFKRNWILGRKKKLWALTGPLDLDDFEDMREFPDVAEEKVVAKKKEVKPEAAASPEPEPAPTQVDEPQKPPAQTAQVQTAQAPKAQPKGTEIHGVVRKPGKPKEEEGLSELEKILREVDD